MGRCAMKTLSLSNADVLARSVEDATRGEPTLITRDGKASAMIVPLTEGRKLYSDLPDHRPSFADLLLAMPAGLEIERLDGPFSTVDL